MAFKDPEVQREYQRQWMAKRRLANPDWQRERNSSRRIEIQEKISAIKAASPCADCGGFFHPVCMDFDHLDPSTKSAGVADMVRTRYSLDRIMEEVAKCELVCANCHRLRTFEITPRRSVSVVE